MLAGRYVDRVEDGINQYVYVRNNPVNGIDPYGTDMKNIVSGPSVGTAIDPFTASNQNNYYSLTQEPSFVLGSRDLPETSTLKHVPSNGGAGQAHNALISALGAGRIFNTAKELLFPKPKTVEDLISTSTPGRSTSGRTRQFDRSGGLRGANKDFDSLKPSNVEEFDTQFGPARRGTLPDGETIIVRPGSKPPNNRPTIEIQKGKNRIKFRFDD